jgi:signal transduction histidine kinase
MINAGLHPQGVSMALNQSQQYLMNALDAFDKRVVAVSPEFELPVAAGQDPKVQERDLVGCQCDKAIHGRGDPLLRNAERCRGTVRKLLEFARQKGRFAKPMDITKAVDQCLTLIQNQSMFHNIEIRKQLADGLPWIVGDSRQLNHVFMNIIINSAQAMEGKGAIDITIGVAATKDCMVIKIKDTAPGIDEDHLKHIFELFFTTKEEGQGTGLGLSVVYNIIEHHGGTINASSKPVHGTIFTIELPIFRNHEKRREK